MRNIFKSHVHILRDIYSTAVAKVLQPIDTHNCMSCTCILLNMFLCICISESLHCLSQPVTSNVLNAKPMVVVDSAMLGSTSRLPTPAAVSH